MALGVFETLGIGWKRGRKGWQEKHFPGQINQDFELEGMVLGGLFFPISDVAFLVEEA